jgi:formylglycine-generating enzyme required for sulfatase activity
MSQAPSSKATRAGVGAQFSLGIRTRIAEIVGVAEVAGLNKKSILVMVVWVVVLVGAALAWKLAGKPGQGVYQQLSYNVRMSLPWRDFVAWRAWKGDAPALIPRLVALPLGAFEYGCKPGRDVSTGDECPPDQALRTVDLRQLKGVCTAMSAHEVSFDEYDYYVWSQRQLPSSQRPVYPEAPADRRGLYPVVNVSYEDAVAYTRWLSETTRQTWRLPTEEEWEYAARAVHADKTGSQEGPWWWGKEPPTQNGRASCISCDARSDGIGAPVGSFRPSPFGLYDMAGNVSEWTLSIYTPDNRPAAADAPDAPHVRRGGSWGEPGDDTRASTRRYSLPDLRFSTIGFRVCRE